MIEILKIMKIDHKTVAILDLVQTDVVVPAHVLSCLKAAYGLAGSYWHSDAH
jgi:hypothetical protein